MDSLKSCALCQRPETDLTFGSLLEVDDSHVSQLTNNIIFLVDSSATRLCAKCCQELTLVGQLLFKWRERIVLALEMAIESFNDKNDEHNIDNSLINDPIG